ncbi:MAG: EAL domain-containing protein [Gammaproteobacteria bacterium]|nr:EAL domain-containing protein [Gammaproteobacteria bacterium]
MHLFIPAIWMVSGFSLFAGTYFIISGVWHRREPGFLAFGLLCVLIALCMIVTAAFYAIQSIEAAMILAHIKIAILCLAYPTAVWFLAEYTQLRNRRYWLIGAWLAFGILFIADLLPFRGLWYSAMTTDEPLALPWHEILTGFFGSPGPFAYFYHVAVSAFFIWVLWRCVMLWREDHVAKAWPLTLYLVVQTAALLHDQIIAPLNLHGPAFTDFALLALVLIMSFTLRRDMQARARALDQNVNALQAETLQRQRVEEHLQHMAYHDFLTDLPNRRLLHKVLRGALTQHRISGKYGAIVFLDLDHFKTINDSLGHHTGDELLKLVAVRLQSALPETHFVCRLGGDEFAVVLSNLEKSRELARTRALHAVHTLTASLAQPFKIGQHELTIGASTGVSVFPDSNADESGILRQADMALFSAKAAGRNTSAVFASQMQAEASRRMVVEKGLRVALERRELKLYYQPQVDISGKVIGAEALLRWFHPDLGFIEPRHFVPVAEETGLIHAIGDFVLHSVCAQLRTWDEDRMPAPQRLSLNISPWQLATRGFVTKVQSATQSAGIEPSRLTLEITEHALLQDMDEVVHAIQELNALGARFSIDDFGAGYSALGSIKKLPLQELKIDRLFINEMRLDRKDNFIETIIAMARTMNLLVIAEGVESEAQRTALMSMGCLGFQGYLISAPLSVREFEHWLLGTRPRPQATLNVQQQNVKIETRGR